MLFTSIIQEVKQLQANSPPLSMIPSLLQKVDEGYQVNTKYGEFDAFLRKQRKTQQYWENPP